MKPTPGRSEDRTPPLTQVVNKAIPIPASAVARTAPLPTQLAETGSTLGGLLVIALVLVGGGIALWRLHKGRKKG